MENREPNKKWIDEVISSIDGMERASPSDELFSKINSIIKNENQIIIPIRNILAIAVSIAILITINIVSITSDLDRNSQQNSDQSNQNQILNDFKFYE